MRKWGRWVSEIRIPQTKYRIWLALYCIHGSKGKFNFPNELRPEFPDGLSTSFFKSEIKAVASRFASTPQAHPNLEGDALVLGGGETGKRIIRLFFTRKFSADELIMMEPDFIWDILDRN
ncbi:hypothetical protein MKW92_034711 [Papaver armeniacum]|nr:hypothetical protein MKW92_034711 [Papaver armeniacum]